MDLIHRLRQKPDHEKQRIAAVVATSFTALIAVAWIVSLGVRMTHDEPVVISSEVSKEESTSVKERAVSSLASVKEGWDSFKEGIADRLGGRIEVQN